MLGLAVIFGTIFWLSCGIYAARISNAYMEKDSGRFGWEWYTADEFPMGAFSLAMWWSERHLVESFFTVNNGLAQHD